MGIYVNPGNNAFIEVLRDPYYVDKTEMISYVNSCLETSQKEICFTRPRRFGKTTAANMLAAYYSCGCDSNELFQSLKISTDPSYIKHLNQYPVIYFGLIDFLTDDTLSENVVKEIQRQINDDLSQEYPSADIDRNLSLRQNLLKVSSAIGKKFIIIIDEWDMLFREFQNDRDSIREYIDFLRNLFRGTTVSQYLAGAYMTGILPIIKYNTQSALSDFNEYTMLNAGDLAPFVGFTEEEVHLICEKYPAADFDEMRRWYDGYYIEEAGHIYCPNSVMKAAPKGKYQNYWASTSAFESLTYYIQLNYDGLKEAILQMLDGEEVPVDVAFYENNLNAIKSKEDVLVTLIHLGYLGYHEVKKTAFIPNLEIRQNFLRAIKTGNNQDFIDRIKRCDEIIEATLHQDENRVAELIQEVHDCRPPKQYNNENALRYIILNAYDYSPSSRYTVFEELSSGYGYCDILCLAEKGSERPAIIIELKWDKSADEAIKQIKEKRYFDDLKKRHYEGDVLLVGINYNLKNKGYRCRIEAEFLNIYQFEDR